MSGLTTTTFNINKQGLGEQIPGTDYYSGLVFFPATFPSGFDANNKIKLVYTLNQAEDAGITEALFPIEHYHISEFFRGMGRTQGTPKLWIYIGDPTPTAEVYDGTQLIALSDFSNGEIKQIGVYTDETFATSLITSTATYTEQMEAENRPTVVLLAADFSAVTDLTLLADLRAVDKDWIGVVVTQDGTGKGKDLFTAQGKSITSLGLTLGLMASTDVATNIGHAAQFNVTNGNDYQLAAYANGDLVRGVEVATVKSVTTKGYIQIVNYLNKNGSYHDDAPLVTAADSDLRDVERARTIAKAIREIDTVLFPFKNGKIYLDATTGQIQEVSALPIEADVLSVLNRMVSNGEISPDQTTGRIPKSSVVVDRISDVITSGKVNLTVRIVPVAIGREYVVNIGFVPKIVS